MRRALLVLLLLAGEARAHDPCLGCGPEGPGWDSGIALALLLAVGGLYAAGLGRLWRRAGLGRGVPWWRALCFACGLALVIAAYASPLHELGDRLFVAHMAEHELLLVVAAPLLALARPFGALAWGLPAGWRRPAGAIAGWRGVAIFARPGTATLLHGAAVWAWHAPVAYEAALTSPGLHWLQHVSLLGSALLFWHAVLRSRAGRQGAAVFCLFVTAIHTGCLGILLTAARAPIYANQSAAAHHWDLTPLEDQQLAGIVMWVPGGLIYAAAALALVALWIRSSSGRMGSRLAPA
jgi:cytochrome c oxidase assembly factor CtaG